MFNSATFLWANLSAVDYCYSFIGCIWWSLDLFQHIQKFDVFNYLSKYHMFTIKPWSFFEINEKLRT